MVNISYVYKNMFFRERDKKKKKKPISRILLFHLEIGRRELQTL